MSANVSASKPTLGRSTLMVRPVRNLEDLRLALVIRTKVFVQEMGIPQEQEYDENDKWPIPENITHYLVTVGTQPLATCRLNKGVVNMKIERMAVEKFARSRGIGRALLQYVEQVPVVRNSKGVLYCYAMKDKELFYLNSGWITEAGHGELQEVGIPHVAMIRRRRPAGASDSPQSLSHIMVRTMDIARARRFYSLLGFQDTSRFRMNGVRGAWIEATAGVLRLLMVKSPYIEQRVELLEMKTLVTEQQVRNAWASGMADYTPGLGHMSFDLTRACTDLTKYLTTVQDESLNRFQMALRVVEKPKEVLIGSMLMEVAFISDADGTLLELTRLKKKYDDPRFDAQW